MDEPTGVDYSEGVISNFPFAGYLAMSALAKRLKEFHHNESAVTATEYVSLLVLIACGSIISVSLFGGAVNDVYREVHEGMSNGKIRGGLSSGVD